MNGREWNHQHVDANGITLHYVRHGEGHPLVLLHGWPEFWYVWRKNFPVLAESFEVVAPDLRGFGDSDKPGGPPEDLLGNLVEDLRALADALGFERFGVVSHDVGAYVAQGFARSYPERLSGLFFFNCPYPGIGRRWADAGSINEIWCQTFNQQPWAASLVGENRKTCETYFRHFLNHWAQDPSSSDSSSTRVRAGAVRGVAEVADAKVCEELGGIVLDHRAFDDEVVNRAIEALGKLGSLRAAREGRGLSPAQAVQEAGCGNIIQRPQCGR